MVPSDAGPAAVELVVARYREDLSWLRRVPAPIRVTVYNKGPDGPDAIPLPNRGREAHSYLHHVTQRYDSLARITVFCQGRPFDHVPDLRSILGALVAGNYPVPGFRWLGFVIDRDDCDGARLFQNWTKNPERRPLPMAGFWRELWDESAPGSCVFYLGAHFAVTREQICRRPRRFYETALEISRDLPDAAHCFERCWDRVFAAAGIPPPFRDRELPIYLRPVQRLNLTWADVEADRRLESLAAGAATSEPIAP